MSWKNIVRKRGEEVTEKENTKKRETRKKLKIDENYGDILSAKQKKEIVKRIKTEKKKVLSVQQTIPYDCMFKDGICRVGDHLYNKMIAFTDINYSIESDENRAAIFNGWCDFLNYFNPELRVQFCSSVLKINLEDLEKYVEFPSSGSNKDLREEYTEILKQSLKEGRNEYARVKYIVFGLDSTSLKQARQRLTVHEEQIRINLSQIGVHATVLNGSERLHVLRNMLRPEDFEPFVFNYDLVNKTGLQTVDFVSPTSLAFQPGYFRIAGKQWGQSCFMQMVTESLDDNMLRKILEKDSNILFSVHLQSMNTEKAVKLLKNKLSEVEKMKVDEQTKASRKGYDMDILPPDLIAYNKDVQRTLENVQSGDDRMFITSIVVTVIESSKKKLDDMLSLIQAIASQEGCQIKTLDYRQEQGFMSSLPLGICTVRKIETKFMTRSVAGLIPFTTVELFQKRAEALYCGQNQLTNNIIMADRKTLDNPNGLILGVPGGGKSFYCKKEFLNVCFRTEDDIIICDPESEYGAVVKALGGTIVTISPTSDDYINPLELNTEYYDKPEKAVKDKVDFILSLMEQMIGGYAGLLPAELSVIDLSAFQMYMKYLAHPTKGTVPTLQTLQEEIVREDSTLTKDMEAAKSVANKMNPFTVGSSNLFCHHTNVNTANRIVSFDIQGMGERLKKVAMLTVQDYVWSRVRNNRKKGKTTRYYMDEFHLLLRDEQTAKYTVENYKRFRKYGGIPTGITQNISDLLSSTQVSNIFSNCEYICMLKQKGQDKEILQSVLAIPDDALRFVTNNLRGSGLLYFGGNLIPFKDEFPENTKIYRLITTKPGESPIAKGADSKDLEKAI